MSGIALTAGERKALVDALIADEPEVDAGYRRVAEDATEPIYPAVERIIKQRVDAALERAALAVEAQRAPTATATVDGLMQWHWLAAAAHAVRASGRQ